MEMSYQQFEQIRAKQRENESMTKIGIREFSHEAIARAARDAKREVDYELSIGKYTAGTTIRA